MGPVEVTPSGDNAERKWRDERRERKNGRWRRYLGNRRTIKKWKGRYWVKRQKEGRGLAVFESKRNSTGYGQFYIHKGIIIHAESIDIQTDRETDTQRHRQTDCEEDKERRRDEKQFSSSSRVLELNGADNRSVNKRSERNKATWVTREVDHKRKNGEAVEIARRNRRRQSNRKRLVRKSNGCKRRSLGQRSKTHTREIVVVGVVVVVV